MSKRIVVSSTTFHLPVNELSEQQLGNALKQLTTFLETCYSKMEEDGIVQMTFDKNESMVHKAMTIDGLIDVVADVLTDASSVLVDTAEKLAASGKDTIASLVGKKAEMIDGMVDFVDLYAENNPKFKSLPVSTLIEWYNESANDKDYDGDEDEDDDEDDYDDDDDEDEDDDDDEDEDDDENEEVTPTRRHDLRPKLVSAPKLVKHSPVRSIDFGFADPTTTEKDMSHPIKGSSHLVHAKKRVKIELPENFEDSQERPENFDEIQERAISEIKSKKKAAEEMRNEAESLFVLDSDSKEVREKEKDKENKN